MFKTFGERLKDIESFYEKKDYSNVVVETAILMEHALGYLFRNFHRTLKTPKERVKFLEFEKQNDEKYSVFLKKPTIGIALGFYDSLLKHIPEHQWLHPDLKSAISSVNVIRNSHVHAGKKAVTDSEAGEVIDAAELFLKKNEIYDLPFEDVGFPLKHYLVYTSIQDKFQKGETESDFKKIINDASKLIPDLMNSMFNKVYPFLSIENKEKLNQLHPKTLGEKSKEISLRVFIEIFDEIQLFEQIEGGEHLKTSLQFISDKGKESYSRRDTRHHVNILEIIFNFVHNKKLDFYRDFAEAVKKKYLEDNQINETDRIILADRARELKISKKLAETIERTVVRTIEKELILFQTLYEDKPRTDEERITNKVIEHRSTFRLSKKVLYSLLSVFLILICIFIVLLWPKDNYTKYEKSYYQGKYEKGLKASNNKRSLKNIKAHYFFIQCISLIHETEDETVRRIKNEYRNLLEENPQSPEAHFYLGMLYAYNLEWRAEADSSWLLINKAIELGLDSEFAEIEKASLLSYYQLSSQALEAASVVIGSYANNPRACGIAAPIFYDYANDTAKAVETYRKALKAYPKYITPNLRLARISLAENDFITASSYLEKAKKINSKASAVIKAYAEYYRREGRFDKAEEYFLKAIKDFGEDDVELYRSLADLYLMQDKTEEGLSFLDDAVKSFPADRALNYYRLRIVERQRWLETESNKANEEKLIPWMENFDLALEEAIKEKKPLLVDFYTTWCVPCRLLEEKTYPDSLVQLDLASFIPVKLNAEMEVQLSEKYDIKAFPTLLVISPEGSVLHEIKGYRNPYEFVKALNEGKTAFDRYISGKSLTREKYTQVSNFEDAKIMAGTKNIPVMVVVGSDKSVWSKKLVDETIIDPTFQSEFTDIVYLYVDQASSEVSVNDWTTNTVPNILFFDSNGTPMTQLYGYQPPEILADFVEDVKNANDYDVEIEKSINWIYQLEEAKTLALMHNKYIFVNIVDEGCPPCNWMNDNTFKDDQVIGELADEYICLILDERRDNHLIESFEIDGHPTFLILDNSGDELYRSRGYQNPREIIEWLDLEPKLKYISVLGSERYKAFSDNCRMGESLLVRGLYKSAIEILTEQSQILPDYSDNYMSIAKAFLWWEKPVETIEFTKMAISNGASIDETIIEYMIDAHLQLRKEKDLLSWFKNSISDNSSDRTILSKLYLGFSEAYEILQEKELALKMAEESVKYNPNNFETHLQLGRILYGVNDNRRASTQLIESRDLDDQDPRSCIYLGLIAEEEGRDFDRESCFQSATERSQWAPLQISMEHYLLRPYYYLYPGYIELIENGYLYSLMIDTADVYQMRNSLAYHYANEGIHLEEALTLINRCLEDEPDEMALLDTKAWVLYQQGKIDEANETLNSSEEFSAFSLLQKDIEVLYHIGKIKEAIGDTAIAQQCYEMVMKIREPGAAGIRIQDDLNQLLGYNN